jgi:DNA polymerase-3 subunit alpha
LDGAASVESLARRAAELGMKHLAITDHGNMFGVPKFRDACAKHGICPIIGSEFYMAQGSRFEKSGSEYGNKYYHLVLLAKDLAGYRSLIKLSSYSYTEGFYYKPRIDEEILTSCHEGLIGLSACVSGEIPSLILAGDAAGAEKRARFFEELLGPENFYLELQDHLFKKDIQKKANAGLMDLAGRTGIPLVATNDIHYLHKEDAAAHDILLCISTQKRRNDEKRMRFDSNEFYLKSGDEMAALFPDCPEAVRNTVLIAEKCRAEIPKPGPLLPDFEIPEGFSGADEYLRRLALDGLARRYPEREAEVRPRAEYELDVIITMGFTGYFLIVADFINWAKERGIPVGPGRGSGAGSIVAYALRITDIDPLKYNLLFERFLNPERVSMPDFDVDFCNERREEVIEYVTGKYGRNRVGQIVTFGTLKAKAVLKDVARALDFNLEESNMLTKLIPEDPKMTLEKAFEAEPKLKELEAQFRYQELFKIARKLEGKNRHNSIHAAGIVIGKTDLTDYVPLCWDPKTKAVASQYTMDFIEDQGLVKMDFLGLKTLDLIKNTVELVRRRGGENADFTIEGINERDEATYRMLGEGKSAGVFQFESGGMKKTLKQARPNKIEDLIALNALYRPGPMDHIDQFVDSKWGRRAVEYPDPCLEDILKETYGVIVYQEQVMQVAQRIAGYSLGQADILRRAMGKKKQEVMEKEKERFVAGAKARGFSEKDAARIFDILIPFAGYGFNKSHAAAYSVVAYQTAYLKANFPAEFMAANLTNEIDRADKLPDYIEEARRMGLAIDPPDVNRSERFFSVSDGRIVYGFLGIKGVGEQAAREIVARRTEGGQYRDFIDFLERTDIRALGKKTVELLIRTGAFDCFGMGRGVLNGNMERAVEFTQSGKEDKRLGQAGLFDQSPETETRSFDFREYPEWGWMEKLSIEKELLGFYFSGHPMDDYKAAWKQNVSLHLGNLTKKVDGTYTVIGIIKSLRFVTTKKGDTMAFAVLGDYNGDIDVTFFPDLWEKARNVVAADKVAAVRGRVDMRENRDRPDFIAEELLDADRLRRDAEEAGESARSPAAPESAPAFRAVHIRLCGEAAERDESLYPLRKLLTETSGAFPVFIHVPVADGEAVIKADGPGAGEGALAYLKECQGVDRAWVE